MIKLPDNEILFGSQDVLLGMEPIGNKIGVDTKKPKRCEDCIYHPDKRHPECRTGKPYGLWEKRK